jgi:methionyl-tRNA synthetase
LGKFYVTTPIYYVNDKPHIGHAYTNIAADMLARWHRLKGDEVFFLTGTDEHGEKVAKAAAKAGENPKEFVDRVSEEFKTAWKTLNISYDRFIRTTEDGHIKTVTEFIRKVFDNGYIYKGEYEGWYCLPDETFWTELQLKEGRCPECGREVSKIKEETYFFKLSKFQDRLLDLYSKNPKFLSPSFRSSEIINRVKEGLKDISISRPNVAWGIPFPYDEKHTIYVWVDALINYLSALGWPDGTFGKFWPADVHLMAKDINWFHTVIWPALLLAAGVEPPQKIFAHGFWTVEGRKMSKSLGNTLDPLAIAKKYSTDALRYFLFKEMPFGEDGNFSEEEFVARINGELVADLGNLVYRALTLTERYTGNIDGVPELDAELHLDSIVKLMDDLDLCGALNEIWTLVRATNKYVNQKEAWKLEGSALGAVLYNLLESCRIIAILLYPFMPETSESINAQLGVKRGSLKDCGFRKFEGSVKKGAYLFQKVKTGPQPAAQSKA